MYHEIMKVIRPPVPALPAVGKIYHQGTFKRGETPCAKMVITTSYINAETWKLPEFLIIQKELEEWQVNMIEYTYIAIRRHQYEEFTGI